jgi:hypothetical protein
MSDNEIVSVGWDVRGWQSRAQAVAVAAFNGQGTDWIALSPAFGFETGARPGLEELLVASGLENPCDRLERAGRVVVAIDAPLAFPRAFTALLGGRGLPRRKASEIENPLAYRDCDRWIRAEHGKKPLSAAFDRLGNPATLAITVCGALRENGFRIVPMDGAPATKSAIEVYPGVHKCGSSRVDAAIAPLARHLPDGLEAGTDLYDAAICALLGLLFAGAGEPLGLPAPAGPPAGHPTDEGWIYALPAAYVHNARGDS